ncbi:hypothetical protein NQ317_017057 [Molorchus minor]|uniref:Uncharacterized protein n=1 Tax=Molorchus minor TaxID=1323400 RepID=A0ABQ9K5Z6_9CUCU|nr:hypothetical protein NQ317_017057 [Molorchus minor]
MVKNIIYLLILIVYSTFISAEYYNQYECNLPLLNNGAVLSATSSMSGRGPKNAILYGGKIADLTRPSV